jgi:hypothetical protein
LPQRIAGAPAPDDRPTILLFGPSAARKELLPAVRREASLAGLGIVPCEAADEAAAYVARRPDLLVCVIVWPDDRIAELVGFIEDLRRRQTNPLLEIIVRSAVPLPETQTARLRSLRVTRHRRPPPLDSDEFGDVLASAVRHAFEKRALRTSATPTR